ncbi:Hydrolase (HAD superfamily) [Levilactobacillus brevis]|nr:Hydrolase (HAD superfamily) [Levilactobacillus brevis]
MSVPIVILAIIAIVVGVVGGIIYVSPFTSGNWMQLSTPLLVS